MIDKFSVIVSSSCELKYLQDDFQLAELCLQGDFNPCGLNSMKDDFKPQQNSLKNSDLTYLCHGV